jgi:glycosyltransferase involved in cell wall biosynthesis
MQSSHPAKPAAGKPPSRRRSHDRRRAASILAAPAGQRLSIAMLAPCPFPTRQGTQVLIRHLAAALSRAGHEVHLVTYGNGEYDLPLPFAHHRSGLRAVTSRRGPSLLKPAADAVLALTAARVIKAHRCDVLHAHNVEGLAVGALLKLRTSLPLVYHTHSAMGPELPTYFRGRLARACASAVGDVVDRTLPLAADAVIAFDSDHKALHEAYGVAEQRIHIIPPGLDGDEIRGASPREIKAVEAAIGNGPWVLYAGNPDGYQNLDLLWRSFALVRQRRPDARLLVATHHPASTFAKLLRHAVSSEGVVVHTFSSLEELRAVFAVASVGVCPRALWTGAPIKVLNYLAAGLPVVACRASARHILTERTGIMVADNPEQYAAAMLKLLDRVVPARKTRSRAFDRFRLENHLPAYDAVYRQVLQKRAQTQRS